jgi:hypothetical protein
MNEYGTIVCPNGIVLQFRLRDTTVSRYKVFVINNEVVQDDIEAISDIDSDDCDGDGFAAIVRTCMNYGSSAYNCEGK